MTTGLAVALFAMTSLALALLLAPLLLRPRGPARRDAYNLAVYKDQLAEVERDLGRGVLASEEAEAARAEIARRILALKPNEGETGAGSMALVLAMVAILCLPIAAWTIYGQLGSPGLPDQPFAERQADDNPVAAAPHGDIGEAITRLSAHLTDHPDDLNGWLLLARSEVSLGHYQKAADAYRRAAELSGQRPDIAGDWGEAQVAAAGGSVTPAARQAFETALRDPESAPRSRYYLALAQLQQGDVKAALDAWVALAQEAPPDAEWLPLVRQRIAQAAGTLGIDPATLGQATAAPGTAPGAAAPVATMPSAEAVAAARDATAGTSPGERQAMINAMVERLAARLEQQPDDVEGWTRLGRSYMVLSQPDKARDAYARAVRLRPNDAELVQALAAANSAAAAKAGAAGSPGAPK